MPEPTATPEAPAESTEMGQIKPLLLTDPMAIATDFSEAELTCLAGVADIGRLMQIFTAPETATPEEQTGFFGCLEDKNLVRLFLAPVLEETGPLSVESSSCILTLIQAVDLSGLMVEAVDGNEESGVMIGLSIGILTAVCLNDAEWESAAAGMEIDPEDRQNFQCAVEALGGPEGLAQTFSEGTEAAFGAVLESVVACALQAGGDSGG